MVSTAEAGSYPQGVELVTVPAGSYVPLFPSDKPKTSDLKKSDRIEVKGFKTLKIPVTNLTFLDFVSKHPQWRRSKIDPLFSEGTYLQHWKSDLEFDRKTSNSPVVFVSWFAANAFCQSLDMRLPTTEEWEYLASMPIVENGKLIPEEEKVKLILEWYSLPSDGKLPQEVGGKQNLLGVFDLFGLVWEWTYDFNSALMSPDSRSNSDEKIGLFCGGGAAGSNSPDDYAAFMRYAYRSSLKGRYNGINLGFRCVL